METLLLQLGVVLLVVLLSAAVHAWLTYDRVGSEAENQALTLARTEPPDLVISDHMMPRRTGMDLLRAVRADPRLAGVPFVLLSAARPAGREEADAFLSKPVDLPVF